MKHLNIEPIVKSGLCMGCGTCVGICPSSSLKITKSESRGMYFPKLDKNFNCENCGLCVDSCPGWKVDFDKLNEFNFGKVPGDIFMGNYLNCYSGFSCDYNIRYKCTSGGIATSLLAFALEKKIADAALVMRMKNDNPLETEYFLARNREEIIEAAGSKYCPTALNVGLKDILKQEGRFAVVGLPCHIQGFRLVELTNKALRDKIVLHIGLFCYSNYTFKATEALLRRLKIKKENVKKLSYRTDGWPGSFVANIRNKDKLRVNLLDYYNRNFVSHSVLRCTLCSDGLSELADISVGDAWLPEYKKDVIGTSLIIARDRIGEDLLTLAKESKIIEYANINPEKVIQAQKNMLFFKKKSLVSRLLILKILGKKTPLFKQELLTPGLKDYLSSVFFYLKRFFLSF